MSSTGVGELFIKHGATRDIAARVRYLHTPLREATNYVVHEVIGREPQARGAVIAISRGGEIVVSSSGYGVLHGYATATVPPTVGVKVE
jgi:isoaspartyl peptidase/L-asparaginase-like protein (Ntn-hydrolase superfamily)